MLFFPLLKIFFLENDDDPRLEKDHVKVIYFEILIMVDTLFLVHYIFERICRPLKIFQLVRSEVCWKHPKFTSPHLEPVGSLELWNFSVIAR